MPCGAVWGPLSKHSKCHDSKLSGARGSSWDGRHLSPLPSMTCHIGHTKMKLQNIYMSRPPTDSTSASATTSLRRSVFWPHGTLPSRQQRPGRDIGTLVPYDPIQYGGRASVTVRPTLASRCRAAFRRVAVPWCVLPTAARVGRTAPSAPPTDRAARRSDGWCGPRGRRRAEEAVGRADGTLRVRLRVFFAAPCVSPCARWSNRRSAFPGGRYLRCRRCVSASSTSSFGGLRPLLRRHERDRTPSPQCPSSRSHHRDHSHPRWSFPAFRMGLRIQ